MSAAPARTRHARDARAPFAVHNPHRSAPEGAWPSSSAAGEPAAHIPALRRAVRGVDPSLPLYDVLTMEEALSAEVAGTRFNTWLLSPLGGMGLVLAAMGVYGLIAYFLVQRTSEIGLASARGAATVHIPDGRHGLSLALLGIVSGLLTGQLRRAC